MSELMDELKKTVSHSEIESFLKCERLHFYQYGMKLGSISPSEALSRGTFGHAALEIAFKHRLETGAPLSDSIDVALGWVAQQMVENPEVSTFAGAITKCLIKFKASGALSEFEILAVEMREDAPMADNIQMSLVIDLIVKDKAGLIGVIDHKFLARFYYGDQTALMPQLPRYIIALRNLGLPVDWVAYSMFNHKNGDWQFDRVEVSEPKIARIEMEHVEVARRILERRYDVLVRGDEALLDWSDRALRVFNTMSCDHCSMKKLCIAELNQTDVQYTLDAHYRVKEPRDGSESTGAVSGSDGVEAAEGA